MFKSFNIIDENIFIKYFIIGRKTLNIFEIINIDNKSIITLFSEFRFPRLENSFWKLFLEKYKNIFNKEISYYENINNMYRNVKVKREKIKKSKIIVLMKISIIIIYSYCIYKGMSEYDLRQKIPILVIAILMYFLALYLEKIIMLLNFDLKKREKELKDYINNKIKSYST